MLAAVTAVVSGFAVFINDDTVDPTVQRLSKCFALQRHFIAGLTLGAVK